MNPLKFEIFSDQIVEINIADKNISANRAGINAFDLHRAAKLIENLERKERNLPFVIVFVIEKPISAKAASGNTFDRRNFDHRIVVRLASVVADKVVTARNVKMADFHRVG